MRWRASTLLLVVGLLAGPAFGQASDEAELQALLSDWLAEESVPGGVLLVSGPYERYLVAAGLANIETGEPVTEETRFYAASTGKMMVTAAILTAVDEGRLSLSDPIDGFVATIKGADQLDRAGPVTIEQLLNHSSGLPEYLNEAFAEASFENPDNRWTPAEALTFAYVESAVPAGTRFEYTNTNYVILGHILTVLDGSLAESLQRWVFRRADMGASTIGAPPDPGDAFAHGYDDDGQDVSALGWNSVLGDGPVITTASDLEAFARALFASQRIVSFASRDDMVQPSDLDPNYGLGVSVEEDEFGVWYGHAGGYDGFEADLRYYPAHDVVLTYLINGNQRSNASLLDEAAAWFFGG
ncbi:MAG: beta-lactamase family protein [Rhizobiales bacterium]|nr:beta-lactamase family protein [Hyphomicrobiales bacterium]MBO6697283.1 beta-lactamase family protein [Hyphomicrobiales bacterium]MBO6736462.1 beta-lactamase family protein [Hyphomicrobiales bacterium]MBO6912932.1 beta-lactamase family protein [Hyphomicrobiales bacterium]MBO6954100.1 beta-lactamase family protein [Hyphomicrobiales bacterium]